MSRKLLAGCYISVGDRGTKLISGGGGGLIERNFVEGLILGGFFLLGIISFCKVVEREFCGKNVWIFNILVSF